jgi:hypothetical protein
MNDEHLAEVLTQQSLRKTRTATVKERTNGEVNSVAQGKSAGTSLPGSYGLSLPRPERHASKCDGSTA